MSCELIAHSSKLELLDYRSLFLLDPNLSDTRRQLERGVEQDAGGVLSAA
jgi:hypothetical protein